jgi:hypothetical protein
MIKTKSDKPLIEVDLTQAYGDLDYLILFAIQLASELGLDGKGIAKNIEISGQGSYERAVRTFNKGFDSHVIVFVPENSIQEIIG